MSGRAGRRNRATRTSAPAAAVLPAAQVPLTHPAFVTAALVAALAIAVSVTFPLTDTDFWQHLLVGKVIWQTHSVPTTQLWSWPTYGAPDVNASWGFRTLVHPFWEWGGVTGLFVWRWLTTLAAFGILWAAARRMGARGMAALLVLVVCALVYRPRSQIRPETLVAVLMAVELWILETRRNGGPDRTLWLVPLEWIWINSHISYHLGFAILGAYAIDAHVAARRGAPWIAPVRPWLVAAGMLAIAFVNPFGWRALWQPFDYFLNLRKEPIFQTIGELAPLAWRFDLVNGRPFLIVFGWPLLLAWRWRRTGRPDVAETLLALFFVAITISGVRFVGFLALAAAPFMARDLAEWLARRPRPAWAARPWSRAAIVSALCVLVGLPAWMRAAQPVRIGIDWRQHPVAAADFMEEHGVRGRGFNAFSHGGYLLYRFWPDTTRLPYMDIHQAGTPESRRLFVLASQEPGAWRELESKADLAWALVPRVTFAGDRLPDFLDADSTWALVFIDDVAALYVRRRGPLAAVADRFAYRVLPAGNARLERIGGALPSDDALREAFRDELERSAAASRQNATAHRFLANLALIEGRRDDAVRHLEQALEADPGNRDARAQRAKLLGRSG